MKKQLHENCSRGIRNACNFYYALRSVFKVICGGFGIAVTHPLTGRYTDYEPS